MASPRRAAPHRFLLGIGGFLLDVCPHRYASTIRWSLPERKGRHAAPLSRRRAASPALVSPPRLVHLHGSPAFASATHAGVFTISPSSGTVCPIVGAMPTSPEKPMSICCVTLSVPKLWRASADAELSALACAPAIAARCASSSTVAVIDTLPMKTCTFFG